MNKSVMITGRVTSAAPDYDLSIVVGNTLHCFNIEGSELSREYLFRIWRSRAVISVWGVETGRNENAGVYDERVNYDFKRIAS